MKARICLKSDGPLTFEEGGQRFVRGQPRTVTDKKLIDWAKLNGFLDVCMLEDAAVESEPAPKPELAPKPERKRRAKKAKE